MAQEGFGGAEKATGFRSLDTPSWDSPF